MNNTYTQRLSSTAGGGLETIFADRISGNFPCVLLAHLHICFRQTPLWLWVPFYENCACEEFESSGRCPITFWLIKITEIASLAIYSWCVDSWCRHGFNTLLHIGIDIENYSEFRHKDGHDISANLCTTPRSDFQFELAEWGKWSSSCSCIMHSRRRMMTWLNYNFNWEDS